MGVFHLALVLCAALLLLGVLGPHLMVVWGLGLEVLLLCGLGLCRQTCWLSAVDVGCGWRGWVLWGAHSASGCHVSLYGKRPCFVDVHYEVGFVHNHPMSVGVLESCVFCCWWR